MTVQFIFETKDSKFHHLTSFFPSMVLGHLVGGGTSTSLLFPAVGVSALKQAETCVRKMRLKWIDQSVSIPWPVAVHTT